MFGMNARDALGHMEDVGIINAAHRAGDAQRRSSMNETMGGVVQAMQIVERDRREESMRQSRNGEVIHGTALQRTLDRMARELAQATGKPLAKVMADYNITRTQHYNSLVNEGLEKGWFERDPRLAMSEKTRTWYVSGLDSDHGF